MFTVLRRNRTCSINYYKSSFMGRLTPSAPTTITTSISIGASQLRLNVDEGRSDPLRSPPKTKSKRDDETSLTLKCWVRTKHVKRDRCK